MGDNPIDRFLHEKIKVPKEKAPLVFTYGLSALFLIAGGAYAAGQWLRHEHLGGKEQEKKSKQSHVVAWGSGHDADGPPALIDLNHDGTEDYVGIFQGEEPRGRYLGAFNGKNGALLWRAVGSLETFGNRRHFALAGGYALVLHSRNTVGTIVRLKDGQVHKTIPGLPSLRGNMCPAPNDKPEVWVDFVGDSDALLDLEAGTKRQTPRPDWCTGRELYGDPNRLAVQPGASGWPNTVVVNNVAVMGLNETKLKLTASPGDEASVTLAGPITSPPCPAPDGESLFLPQGKEEGQLLVVKAKKLTKVKRPKWCPDYKQPKLAGPKLDEQLFGARVSGGIYDGKHFVVVASEQGANLVFGVSPDGKEKLWEHKITGASGRLSEVDLAHGRVGIIYYSSQIRKPVVVALDAKSGKLLWQNKNLPFTGNIARRIRMGKTHVFLPWSKGLKIFQASDGKFVGDVGTGRSWAESE